MCVFLLRFIDLEVQIYCMSNKEVNLKFIEKKTNNFLASTCINMLTQILDEISKTVPRHTIPTYWDEYLYFASVTMAPPTGF